MFTGHLLFLPKFLNNISPDISILDAVRTGDTAVMFFFALSGYVLNINHNNSSYRSWTVKRLVRLYPVYFFAWGFGLITLLAHSSSLISPKVIMLGLIGFQSIDPEINLVINSPLWSLSIEIIFAFIFYYLLKARERPYFLIIMFASSLVIQNYVFESQLVRAMSNFMLGVILSSSALKTFKIKPITASYLLLALFIFYLVIGATWVLDLPSSLLGEVVKTFIVASLISLTSCCEMRDSTGRFASAMGKRSFCIYAFHYPILLAFNYLLTPTTSLQFMLYLFVCIAGTIVISECAYRLIDKPSMKLSGSILNTSSFIK